MADATKEKDPLFYYLNNVFTKKEVPTDSEVKSFVWPINRFLSMDRDLLETISEMSKYIFTLGPRYYKLLLRVVPELKKAPRNKYIKVEKDSDDDLVNRYVQYFKLSRKEVKDYLKILLKNHSKEDVYGFVGLEAE